jgi:hypothetical protein
MRRRLKQAGLMLVVAFAAAQLIRPERASPPTDPGRTIQAHVRTGTELAVVLNRSCGDCHSNATMSGWYTQVAPLSWLLARGVREARDAVNFSEWSAYPPERQQDLLAASCQDVSEGKMPGAYTVLRPDTRLSPQDVETVCAAARRLDAHAADGL